MQSEKTLLPLPCQSHGHRSYWWCREKVSSPEHSAYREHGNTIHTSHPWLSVRQETRLCGVSGLKPPCFRLHKGACCFDHGKRFSGEESPSRKPCSGSSLSYVKTVTQAFRRLLTWLVNVSWCPDKVHIVLAFIMSSIKCRPGTMCILHSCSAVVSFGEESPRKKDKWHVLPKTSFTRTLPFSQLTHTEKFSAYKTELSSSFWFTEEALWQNSCFCLCTHSKKETD